ncbi:MAG: hypothetical protein NWE99_09740 [Candidatus Bathyarchaeota archaeon]|nr:hypothetical protein [Candidatus Bathyarchaeota archaeon]
MPNNANKEEPEGLTLTVYLYAVKKGKPVGPRDVVKGAHLSSPSVAYRHLQKLEDMGLLQKNDYGEYVVKDKARLRGYVWVGKRIMPKMLVYSLIFLGILITELVVLALHYAVESYSFKIFFLLLALVTGSAMAIFIAEGLLQRRRLRQSIQTEETRQ